MAAALATITAIYHIVIKMHRSTDGSHFYVDFINHSESIGFCIRREKSHYLLII